MDGGQGSLLILQEVCVHARVCACVRIFGENSEFREKTKP